MIDLDIAGLVLADHLGVSAVQGEFKVALQDNSDGDRLAELMGALPRSRGL